MSARLRELLTDYALGVDRKGIIEDLAALEVSKAELDDAFFDAFDWRQRNRIYMILSLRAPPDVLEILQRRLAVEENGYCRNGLKKTIEILLTPIEELRADYAKACHWRPAAAPPEDFKRDLRAAVHRFAANPSDASASAKIKEMEPDEGSFEDEMFDSLPPKGRLALYGGLPKWCGQPGLKKILDRRAPVEKDAACHAAITEMLGPF